MSLRFVTAATRPVSSRCYHLPQFPASCDQNSASLVCSTLSCYFVPALLFNVTLSLGCCSALCFNSGLLFCTVHYPWVVVRHSTLSLGCCSAIYIIPGLLFNVTSSLSCLLFSTLLYRYVVQHSTLTLGCCSALYFTATLFSTLLYP